MTSLLRHFLLLLAVLGLVGQGVAYASNPCSMMVKAQISATEKGTAMPGMPGCTMAKSEMKLTEADINKADKGTTPCNGMGLCCLAQVGGGAMAAPDAALNMGRLPISAALVLSRPVDSIPLGWNTLPELDPPAYLG